MDFITIVKEQREELERIEREENIVPRSGLAEAEKAVKFPNILAVLGIRRCGKSIFSHLLVKGKNFGYVNFDDERMIGAKTEDLNEILKAFYQLYGDVEYVVLDEVQNVKGWELFANRLRRTKKVILTGSSSRLLSGELATHLTGRHLDTTLFPFSFREFLQAKKFAQSRHYTTQEKAELLGNLDEYLENGGFPEVQKFGKRMLPAIYEDILSKDVILRHKINKTDELKKLARLLLTNTAQEFTYSKAAKAVSVKHVSTISNWVRYLEDAFLLFKLERFDFKLRQQFLAPKKAYCIDSGLVNAAGFRFSENKGRLMENAVAVQLMRKKAPQSQLEVYYWKDHQHNEVDFLLKKGKKVLELIQVSFANSRQEIREREIKSLLKASGALRCKSLAIITWDFEGGAKIRNRAIKFTPLWKWLLGNEPG